VSTSIFSISLSGLGSGCSSKPSGSFSISPGSDGTKTFPPVLVPYPI